MRNPYVKSNSVEAGLTYAHVNMPGSEMLVVWDLDAEAPIEGGVLEANTLEGWVSRYVLFDDPPAWAKGGIPGFRLERLEGRYQLRRLIPE
jgi:hypothetical protein